jgi:hypothetical protein
MATARLFDMGVPYSDRFMRGGTVSRVALRIPGFSWLRLPWTEIQEALATVFRNYVRW